MNQLENTPFLPVTLEDEHYLSFMCRWAVLSGATNMARGIYSLIGKRPTYITELMQLRFLSKLANSLPAFVDKKHFCHAHTQEKYAATLELGDSQSDSVFPVAEAINSGFSEKHLRWCTGCAREDIASFGAAYWRNSHQDPRLVRCQKHGLPLLATCHMCKRKKTYVSQLSQPRANAECQYCSASLDNKIVRDLTPFQLWLEQLHHLANHGVQFNRHTLIPRINCVVEMHQKEMKLKPRKSWIMPDKIFINAFNSTRACDHFSYGEIPYAGLSSYSALKLSSLLNPDVQQPSVIYALLAWVFLSKEDRDTRFGFFADGQAVQVQL